jgi:hypothetical protein
MRLSSLDQDGFLYGKRCMTIPKVKRKFYEIHHLMCTLFLSLSAYRDYYALAICDDAAESS